MKKDIKRIKLQTRIYNLEEKIKNFRYDPANLEKLGQLKSELLMCKQEIKKYKEMCK